MTKYVPKSNYLLNQLLGKTVQDAPQKKAPSLLNQLLTAQQSAPAPIVPEAKEDKPKRKSSFGHAKGKMFIADDFDAPLPEFKDY